MPPIFLYIILGLIVLFIDTQRVNRWRNAPSESFNFNIFSSVFDFSKRRNRRIFALQKAQNYLKPYEKIFGNLTLANKYCSLILNSKEKSINCLASVYDAHGRKMSLCARNFSGMDIDEYFDMMCGLFNYETTYQDVCNSLRSVAVICESVYMIRKE